MARLKAPGMGDVVSTTRKTFRSTLEVLMKSSCSGCEPKRFALATHDCAGLVVQGSTSWSAGSHAPVGVAMARSRRPGGTRTEYARSGPVSVEATQPVPVQR